QVRRLFNERRVGHAGTLDPMATGLLIMGVGSSTRLLRFAQSEVKRYGGRVKFGVTTDSLDADGAVTDQQPVPTLTPHIMDAATGAMLGPQQQTPPMVSAIKIDGQRLHKLARQGVEVERPLRKITVSAFTLSPTDDPSVWEFDVVCSVGTYVRVLLSDLAHHVGTIAHLVALRRLSSGSHRVEDAFTIDQLSSVVAKGDSALLAPAAFVTALEHVTLNDDQSRAMRMGQRVALSGEYVKEEIAAMDADGNLVGILKRRHDLWKPELVLSAIGETMSG
ncbi:MAG: tRNA pseudouridine(55) synthase TruB, partial [Acidimicrobiales bacterium]